jgi:cation-transporting ATPase 13A3/4/5
VKNFASYENTAVFTVSLFQYLGQAVIFSKGAPYRLTIFSNYLFLSSLSITFAFSFILAFASAEMQPLLDFFTV